MTTTCLPSANGRTESRRSLSQEIDRLDQMLDGLAEAIPATIAESVKEAVSTAVAEAVRITLLELASNPSILAMLRPAPASQTVNPNDRGPKPGSGRIGNTIATIWKGAMNKVKAAGRAIAAPFRGAVQNIRSVNRFWSLRRPVIIALGIGAVVGVAGALSAPWLAGILSGVGAAGTTVGAQFITWSRRVYANFGIG